MTLKSIIAAATLTLALFSPASFAGLRPLTQTERVAMASDIVSGYVVSVKKELREVSSGSNMHYKVQMIVTDVEKGSSCRGAETLTFHYWKQHERPLGWCGDGGQMGTIKLYQIVKTYLTFDETTGAYSLLNPNGFDLINR